MKIRIDLSRSYFPRSLLTLLLFAFVVVAALLAGCSSVPASRPANVNLSGFPPAFREGYADGCTSAGGNFARNNARFSDDPRYAQGWRDGLDICRRQTKPSNPAGNAF